MARAIQREARELLARGQELPSAVIAEEQLAGLPEPVRRYLTYAQVVGKAPIRTVRLKQQGAMPLREGAAWHPLTAEQYFTTKPPAFLWYGTLHPLPLVSVSATDTYADGHGTMHIKALSVIPLGTAQGPEMDHGELLRYLGEMAWFPTALLGDAIRWEALNAGSARASISVPGIVAAATFHVDKEGRFTHVTAERYRKEGKRQVLRPWVGHWDDYREIQGFRVPMKAAASWMLGSGESGYFRGEVTEIEYDQTVPY